MTPTPKLHAPGPSAHATEGERALDALLVAAVRFAAWGAGQGCMPHEEEADCPDDFLLVYSEATGDEHWETLHERVSVALASIRAELKAAREERDRLREQLRESAMDHLARDVTDEQLAEEAAQLRERVVKLEETLRPFAACVFNDNGDVTVSTGNLTVHHWLAADRVERAALSPAPTDHDTEETRDV